MTGRFLSVVVGIIVVAASVTSTTFAGQDAEKSIKHTIQVRYDSTLDQQTIEQGDYEAEFVPGAESILILRRDKQEVARLRIERKELPTAAKYDQVNFRTGENGDRAIVSVTFKGARETFVVTGSDRMAKNSNP